MGSNNEFQCGHRVWFQVLVLLCVTGIVVTALLVARDDNDIDHQFSVTATGKVTAIPDIATLTVGVYTDAQKTAALAVKDNTKKMNEIIAALKGINIEKKDITTANYSLNPVYDWTDREGRKLRGYEVRQNVTIKIRDLDNIGKTIQVTAEKGANQVGGINFTIDDPEDLKKEAVNIAIEKARVKAEELSSESGLKLGKLINMYENQSYMPAVRVNKMYALEEMGGFDDGMPEPAIEAGEQGVVMEVTLVYKVK